MIRENTEFTLDAMLKEESDLPQSYADLADLRRSVRECGGSRRPLRGERSL